MKNFMNEFKKFALRGNVLDMAVGVIVGGAFTGIVNSLTENFINPILNFVTGAAKYSFADIMGFTSTFISAVVNFLITAFVLFCIVKAMNTAAKLGEKKEEPAPTVPTTKVCPFCKSTVAIDATRCPHCTSQLEDQKDGRPSF